MWHAKVSCGRSVMCDYIYSVDGAGMVTCTKGEGKRGKLVDTLVNMTTRKSLKDIAMLGPPSITGVQLGLELFMFVHVCTCVCVYVLHVYVHVHSM